MGKFYFIVVLGDINSDINKSMEERLNDLGDVRQIIDNIYILTCEPDMSDISMLRNNIAGREKGYCLVIRFDHKISFAWSIPNNMSELFNEIAKEVRHEGQ